MVAESPDVVIGMRLLDVAKRQGFAFRRLAPGPDGPLWRKSSLLVPGDLLVTERVSGDVLNAVVSSWPL